MFKGKRNRQAYAKSSAPTGCVYIAVVCAVTCALLVFNIFLVSSFIHANREWLFGTSLELNVQFRIAQAAQIVLPVILTMFQYYLFDRIVDRIYGYGSRSDSTA